MGAAAAVMEGVPPLIDKKTFQRICGDYYDEQLWYILKNDQGFITREVFAIELKASERYKNRCFYCGEKHSTCDHS